MSKKLICPVCLSNDVLELISLRDFPIYQHPMLDSSNVRPPFTLDLEYFVCVQCGHGFQSEFDRELLSTIYSSHYYTKAVDGVGTVFMSDFLDFFNKDITKQIPNYECSLLEIGSSSGELLVAVSDVFPNMECEGVEPSKEGYLASLEKGLNVYNCFFDLSFTGGSKSCYDLIVTRHVIEHVFDLPEFVQAISNRLCEGGTVYVETPSIEFAIKSKSRAPFHVEHVSVFSLSSLASTFLSVGLVLEEYLVTESGNLIAAFRKKEIPNDFSENHFSLEAMLPCDFSKNLDLALNKGLKLVFVGAGAGARTLISELGIVPDVLLDNNPNKVGRHYVGIENLKVQYAPDWFSKNSSRKDDFAVVVSSTFNKEISVFLTAVNWKGFVIYPYDN